MAHSPHKHRRITPHFWNRQARQTYRRRPRAYTITSPSRNSNTRDRAPIWGDMLAPDDTIYHWPRKTCTTKRILQGTQERRAVLFYRQTARGNKKTPGALARDPPGTKWRTKARRRNQTLQWRSKTYTGRAKVKIISQSPTKIESKIWIISHNQNRFQNKSNILWTYFCIHLD